MSEATKKKSPAPPSDLESKELEIPITELPQKVQMELGVFGREKSLKIAHIQKLQRSGPLPPPEEVMLYEKILPGFLDRLLKIQENKVELSNKEADTTRVTIETGLSVEKKKIELTASSEKRGQWMAFCVAMPIILLIGLAIYTHASTEIILGLAAIFTAGNLGAIFVTRHLEKQSQDIALEKSSKTKNND